MLDSLRAFSRTWYAKIFFAVLVLSFALFGISNVIFDLGTNTVARVGDQEITINEFSRAYQSQLNQMGQQFGRVPTSEEALALNIPNTVIGQLAANAALDEVGQDFGLGVSEARLGVMLREDPNFSGTLGGFDRQTFVRVLQQMGYTESDYFEMQTKAARRAQLASALFTDTSVPDAAVELVNAYSGDTRTLDYFVLNETSLPPVADPTNAEMQAYLTEHQDQYRTTETRTVELLALTPEMLAAAKTIPEEEIAAEYERTKESLTRPERRTIRQVVMPDDTAAATFEAGKVDGRTFDDLVAQFDLPVTDLGTLAQSEVNDQALAAAAFALAEGEFVVIPGIGGKRAIQVSAIEAGGAATLDEARADIASKLALSQARTEYTDILDQIEELRAANTPIADIATRYGLMPATVTLTAAGTELQSLTEIPEESRGRVAQAIFEAEQGELPPTVALSANRNIWFDLKSIDPARDQTMDEVKDALVLAITEERTAEAEANEVDKILGELEAGRAIADIAMEHNQFAQLSQPITRNGDGTPVLTAQVAASAFAGGVGHFGAAINEDNDYVVFQVVEVITAAPETVEQARTFVNEAARDTLYSDFVTGLRDEFGVRVNQQAVNQLLALDTATGQ
jgi:peptidyl-prolyl cis-trans isomerase D